VGIDAKVGVQRLRLLRKRLEAVDRSRAAVLAERNDLLAQLEDCGVSRTELAKATGLTAGRITQLLDRASAAPSETDTG
jgi:hypothetical protein